MPQTFISYNPLLLYFIFWPASIICYLFSFTLASINLFSMLISPYFEYKNTLKLLRNFRVNTFSIYGETSKT
nr:MAG TPA: hypothetical protein [Caudoviricetes sp.]